MIKKITQLEFPTLDLAWEGINEYLLNQESQVRSNGGGTYGTELVSYDNYIHIFKSQVRDDYNFGEILGYRYKKWTKLINNYVDMNYLDLVKSEVADREKKKSSHYNHTMHFDNSHGSGKDCLISLTFCRRRGEKNPYVIYNTRASEVTSRLIFDFLLIQRLVEYVYGSGVTVEVVCFIPFMFINVERALFYLGHKGRDIITPKPKEFGRQGSPLVYSPFQERVLVKYDEFLNKDVAKIKYKVHKRSALQIQKNPKTGKPLANAPDLFAKDLTFPYRKKLKDKDIAKLNKDLQNS